LDDQFSIIQEDVFEFWFKLSVEVLVECVETVVSLDIGSAPNDADVQPIEVAGELIVYSFLELREVLIGPQLVQGGQAGILQFNQSFLDESLIVLGDLDGA
jgi:hypothetical protein